MTKFVLALLIIQSLVGGYLFSFTTDAGRPESTARRSRLPSSLLFIHPVLAGSAIIVWLVWMLSEEPALPWVTLGILLVGSAVGGWLGLKTRMKAPDPVAVSPGDPANAQLAEKRIPKPALHVHSAIALSLIVFVTLVAFDLD